MFVRHDVVFVFGIQWFVGGIDGDLKGLFFEGVAREVFEVIGVVGGVEVDVGVG